MLGIKHPARHYIYFLLSRRVFDTTTIVESLQQLGLPGPPKDSEALDTLLEQMALVRREMSFPATFNPRATELSAATAVFLRKWAIAGAWRKDPYLDCAVDLLCDAQLRQALQLMLLSPLSPLTIANRLRDRYELPDYAMNAGIVRAYGHYFWDQGALSTAEWQVFLQKYYPLEKFDYISALQAPRSPAGAAFVLAMADRDASLLAAAERYAVVSATGFRRFMEHMCSGETTPSQTYAAHAALNIMKLGDDELDKHRGGSVELMEELKKMTTIYDKDKPLSIEDMRFMRPVLLRPSEDTEDAYGTDE